jgi:hypothetical protein
MHIDTAAPMDTSNHLQAVGGKRKSPQLLGATFARNTSLLPGCFLTSDGLVLFPLLVLCQIYRQDSCKQEQIVLAGSDFHPIRIGERNPALGDSGDYLLSSLDGEVVLEYASRHMQFFGPWNVDGEAVNERAHDFLMYSGGFLSLSRNMIRLPQCEQLFLDRRQFIPHQITQNQRVVDGEDFAVDLNDRLARLIGDRRIFAEPEELLADDIAHAKPHFSHHAPQGCFDGVLYKQGKYSPCLS